MKLGDNYIRFSARSLFRLIEQNIYVRSDITDTCINISRLRAQIMEHAGKKIMYKREREKERKREREREREKGTCRSRSPPSCYGVEDTADEEI